MKANWFLKVGELLAAAGIDRKREGHGIIARIRDCWLQDMSPDEAAKEILADFKKPL